MKPRLLLYCTKAKPYLYKTDDTMIEKMNGDYHTQLNEAVLTENLNGKIVAECDFEVEKIMPIDISEDDYNYGLYSGKNLLKYSCLDNDDICEYLKDYDGETILKSGYAIHIKNLNVFDEPREVNKLWQFKRYNTHIKNAPQNMMECYDIDGEYKILISIKPESLCKILNEKKTIEVRKKVLKEML